MAELVEGLANNPARRELTEKALAPQKQIIGRELQRMATQREREQGKELGKEQGKELGGPER